MAKKQIRDKDGKFSTKVGDGGLKSQKEVNLKRVLPIVILIAFVGGWLVSKSFAAPVQAPKPGSIEDKQQQSFKAPQVGDVLKPPVSEESRIKDEQSGAFNEHYAPTNQCRGTTIQDKKDCGAGVKVFYRCLYYQRKLIALNGKYSAEYFNKNHPSEADLSSGKIKLKDMIPKDKVMDYYRTEGAVMACQGNDFSKNTRATMYSSPYRP